MKSKPISFLRYFPAFLRLRIEGNPKLQLILANTGWLFADRILKMGVGFVVSVWLARYLGPDQFGLLSFAIALVALFATIGSLGLNSVVVRDLVQQPEAANRILGSACLMQLFGGILAFLLAVTSVGFVRPDDDVIIILVAVLGSASVFRATEVIKYWFESKVQSKYVVWVENSAFGVSALVKVLLIAACAQLTAFAWAMFVECFLAALGLLAIYIWRGGRFRSWCVEAQRVRQLGIDSWPLLLSGLAIMIYMRIDQIMLGQMLGSEAVGIYSAAVQVSEMFYFVPVAIVASVFPSIIKAKRENEDSYYVGLQSLFSLLVIIALSISIIVSFFSDWLMPLLYGAGYSTAGPVLTLHIWSSLFVFLGVASGKSLIVEGYQIDVLLRTISGAILNVIMNLILIPKFGVVGAAFSTLVSYFVSVFIIIFRSRTRSLAIMMLKAFWPYSFFSRN